MPWELRDMSGTLFKNERRQNDTHPNARGECMIDGVVYEISAWTKQGNKGPFQSLSFKRKEDRESRDTGTRKKRDVPKGDFDDSEDIPFNQLDWRTV